MGQNVDKVLKALMPLVNARLKAIESGQVIQEVSAPSILDNPHFTGGISLKSYTSPTDVPKPNLHYTQLTPGGVSLLNSVRRLKAQLPPQHHSSILGTIFHDIEKPYHAVTGAIAAQGDWAAHHKGENALERILGNAKAIGSGLEHGWEGKTNLSYGDLEKKFAKAKSPVPSWLDANKQDELSKTKVGKFAAHFVGDVLLDPISYTGAGGLTKVKNLARSASELKKIHEAGNVLAEAGHNPDEFNRIFLGDTPEDKWISRKTLPNSAQNALTMTHARNLAEQYGHLSFSKTLKANRVIARDTLERQGIKKYKTLSDFQKKLMPGATEDHLIKWNADVDKDIETLAGKLTGTRLAHVTQKSEELLSIASRNNLAGDAAQVRSQLDKALGVKFAGKTVAKFKLPNKLVDTSHALANADQLKHVKEFADAMHEHFTTLFRTGSHLDPLVNTIRLARHASIVERANQHLRSMNSIWRGVSKKTRHEIADAITQGLHNIKVTGGKDLVTGEHVNDLVAHSTGMVRHIEDLVKKGHFTFAELNRTLPTAYKLDSKLANDPEFLMHTWQEWLHPDGPLYLRMIAKDPNIFLNLMQKAAFSAMADREQAAQIVARFGHKIYDTKLNKNGFPVKAGKTDPVTRLLVEKHGYRAPRAHPDARPGSAASRKLIPEYTGHVFQEDVARSIERMHQLVHNDAAYNKIGMHSAGKLFNDVTALFKTIVTKYNPGFHERNFIGEVVNSMGDGVLSMKPYRLAAKVLVGKEKRGLVNLATGEKGQFRVANAINPDSYNLAKLGPHNGSTIILKKHFTGISTTGVTSDQLWHAYVDSGLKSGWIATDTGKYAGRNAVGSLGIRASDAAQHVTENIEDYTRLAHFISRLERSKLKDFDSAVMEAAMYVRKFHFDYTDFTHFERTVMSKIFPFYKWTRKNIPLQLSLLYQRPGYFLAQMKALNAVSNAQGFPNAGHDVPLAEEVMPQWLKDHLAVPVGVGSSGVRYMDAPLPTLQAAQFFGAGAKDTAINSEYMLNPLLKVPLELGTGHQVGGAPIQKSKYFEQMTPFSNLMANLGNPNNTGKSTNLMQFLLGLGLVENTPARIKGELKREQSQLSAYRKKYRAQHGMLPLGHTLK